MEDKETKTKGQTEFKKETDAIKKYNVGTVKMYISPEIIETNNLKVIDNIFSENIFKTPKLVRSVKNPAA